VTEARMARIRLSNQLYRVEGAVVHRAHPRTVNRADEEVWREVHGMEWLSFAGAMMAREEVWRGAQRARDHIQGRGLQLPGPAHHARAERTNGV